MNFFIEEFGDIKVLRLRDERLDSMVAPDLKAQLLVLFNTKKSSILLDLSNVQHVDSSGLGSLLFGLRQARELDRKFAVCGVQKRVKSLIQIAHLTDVIPMFETDKEAMEKLKSY
jgi:anti-sigma B factor antagonist